MALGINTAVGAHCLVRCSVNVYGFSSMRLSLSLPDSVPHPRPNPSRFCLGSSPGLAGYFWKSSGSCKHCGVQACYFHPIVDRLLYGLPRNGRWFHPSSSGSLNGRVIPFVICPIDFFSPRLGGGSPAAICSVNIVHKYINNRSR